MVGNLKYIIMKICIGLCDIFYIDIAFKNKPSFDVAIFCIWSKTKILESSVFELDISYEIKLEVSFYIKITITCVKWYRFYIQILLNSTETESAMLIDETYECRFSWKEFLEIWPQCIIRKFYSIQSIFPCRFIQQTDIFAFSFFYRISLFFWIAKNGRM